MIRALLTLIASATFTMCDGGPVPADCCNAGDTLNVIQRAELACEFVQGPTFTLGGQQWEVCGDVDY